MATPYFGNRKPKFATAITPHRTVGIWLGLGILLLPYLFSWFVLRSGYSERARFISFGWFALILISVNSAHLRIPSTTKVEPTTQTAASNTGSEGQPAGATIDATLGQMVAAAPDGEPSVVAQTAISTNFDPGDCPLVIAATRFGDGSIRALCSNNAVFRVVTLKGKPLAVNCTAAAKFGIKGC